ncbi:MAG: SlyX family protein [Gammaproteobacteria bacterium]
MDNDRLQQLELKLAYLERGNQELSDVVYRQQQDLDALKSRLKRLADQLRAMTEEQGDASAADEKPPHY